MSHLVWHAKEHSLQAQSIDGDVSMRVKNSQERRRTTYKQTIKRRALAQNQKSRAQAYFVHMGTKPLPVKGH